MGEVYAWPEGQIHFWTGAVTASANATALGYATDSFVNLNYAWVWEPNIVGQYLPHLEGRAADVSIGQLMTNNNHLYTLAALNTLTHFRLRQSGYPQGDNGLILYSASINRLSYNGSDGNVYRFQVGLESHDWSAF